MNIKLSFNLDYKMTHQDRVSPYLVKQKPELSFRFTNPFTQTICTFPHKKCNFLVTLTTFISKGSCYKCFSSTWNKIVQSHSLSNCRLNEKVKKVKSVYKPSGPSGQSVSWFLSHEATRSIATPPSPRPPGWDAGPLQSYGTNFNTWVERGTVSKLSCPRTQHGVPGQGSNPERAIRSRAH